jgi:hypothetical protein
MDNFHEMVKRYRGERRAKIMGEKRDGALLGKKFLRFRVQSMICRSAKMKLIWF